ncbi:MULTISPECIES: hypothetical protein [unclassified Methylophilus]|uniref:hypothetical protein n=1 Tax=unclassified Methylophilus TaxID=2630143 RepID=UPI0006FAEDCB|nr:MULTISPECIES: hypothetical protein [unclassified Methylophilus]KQT37279.1 hypothetical protein ASG34_12985 [Methylophilus sp. Leaf416]KQT55551.1 hypothetical protein ASG44_08695 [Methylophilus sp. Leaf459]
MSSTFHPEKSHIKVDHTKFVKGNNASLKPFHCEKGLVEIGKLNIFLIGVIGVIIFGLIAQEDGSTLLSTQDMRVQTVTTPEIAAIETPKIDTPSEEQPEAPLPESKPSPKKRKKNETNATVIVTRTQQPESAAGNQVQHTEANTETAANHEAEQPTLKEPQKNMLVFNIWSVSELRLRSAFTKLINDSSASASILESRKKEYLSFVNKRSHKCGELNSKFASNINTVEKLTFKDKDVEILECHTSENTTELNRLNELGMSVS